MKSSIRTIIGWVSVIFGCCALAFACILAWMEWGGRAPGGWLSDSDLHGLAREVGIAMAISAAIGVGTIVLGVRLARVRPSSNAGPS
jgi:hypothetical protein